MIGTKIKVLDQKSKNKNDKSVTASSPNIFELNDFCFEDLFDWLSLDELKTLRQTCWRMKEIVDYYINWNYPKSFQCLRIDNIRFEELFFYKNINFELVSCVHFVEKPQKPLNGLDNLLQNAETIEIECELFPICEFEVFLKQCTNLKNLMIRMPDMCIGDSNKWLLQCYPTLEHIGFESSLPCFELKIFFEKNPNVQMISTTFKAIWENRAWLLTSNIHIERLIICKGFSSDIQIDLVCDILNELFKRGFYKRLHLYYYEYNPNILPQITTLESVETLLYVGTGWSYLLSSFTNLIELHILDFFDDVCLDHLANTLTNLRRICIHFTSIDAILPLIRFCPRLMQIRITFLQMLSGMIDNKIDLMALNNERKNVRNSNKITIFVNENIFLENKWNQPIDLSLIALKRHLSWKPMDLFYPAEI